MAARRPPHFRRRRFDDLGLRRALGDRMLPLLVAAMAFLAALALAGSVGAASLARHWQQGAASAMTVQVPRPGEPAADAQGSRLDRVVAILHAASGVAAVRPLSDADLADLLRPWLGSDAGRLALPLPAVIEVRLAEPQLSDLRSVRAAADLADLARRLQAAAPGTLAESHGVWLQRLSILARSLQAVAGAALLVVALVAAAVITVATRAGLGARREAIEIVHGLGATDGYIAGRFAGRATRLAAFGAAAGALAALPVLLLLADMAAPFLGSADEAGAADAAAAVAASVPAVQEPVRMLLSWFSPLPPALWVGLPCLPLAAALIGFVTAQGTVRRWLRHLP